LLSQWALPIIATSCTCCHSPPLLLGICRPRRSNQSQSIRPCSTGWSRPKPGRAHAGQLQLDGAPTTSSRGLSADKRGGGEIPRPNRPAQRGKFTISKEKPKKPEEKKTIIRVDRASHPHAANYITYIHNIHTCMHACISRELEAAIEPAPVGSDLVVVSTVERGVLAILRRKDLQLAVVGPTPTVRPSDRQPLPRFALTRAPTTHR